MNIAWGTVAVLVLLLPGFVFYVALYAAERFSRDTTPRNVPSQLAVITLVSFLVHAVLFALFGALHWGLSLLSTDVAAWSHVDLRSVFVVATGPTGDGRIFDEVARNAAKYTPLTVLYVLASVAGGLLIGTFVGKKIAAKPPLMIRHRWLYGLRPPPDQGGGASVYILSTVEHEGQCLCFSGYLETFGIDPDGKFTYVVIQKPSRFTLTLKFDAEGNSTSVTSPAKPIGTTQNPARDTSEDILYVPGSTIRNCVFVPQSAPPQKALDQFLKGLDDFVAKAKKELGLPPGPSPKPSG